MFFPACARRFGLGRPALLAEGRDEAAEGGMLASALQVLQKARTEHPLAACLCSPNLSSLFQLHAPSGCMATWVQQKDWVWYTAVTELSRR